MTHRGVVYTAPRCLDTVLSTIRQHTFERNMLGRRVLTLIICLSSLAFGSWWINKISSLQSDLAEAESTQSPSDQFAEMLAKLSIQESRALEVTQFVVTDEMMENLPTVPWLETLILDEGRLTDQALDSIKQLSKLRHLRIRKSPITDRGLKQISQIGSLWYLNLPHAECTAEGISYLQDLPSLRQLRLGSPRLGNEVSKVIAELSSLRSLHLIGVPITDEGLKILARMPRLQSLYLDDSIVTEDGWEWLFEEAPNLHVHVNQKHHDRDTQSHDHN